MVEVFRVRGAVGIVLARRGASVSVVVVRADLALVLAAVERLERGFGEGDGREREVDDILSVFTGVTFVAALIALRVSISTFREIQRLVSRDLHQGSEHTGNIASTPTIS